MIPIEIDHIVGLVVEGVVPEAFKEVVVKQSLDIMGAGGDSEDWNRLLQGDRCVQAGQLAPEFRNALAGRITIFRRKAHEAFANVTIGEDASCAHLTVDIKV